MRGKKSMNLLIAIFASSRASGAPRQKYVKPIAEHFLDGIGKELAVSLDFPVNLVVVI